MMNDSLINRKRAVALHYDKSEAEAPRVKATGSGYVAEEIIKLAQEHGIPVHEDPGLVEILAKLEINQQIPTELYEVIAEVLAMVYNLEKRAVANEKQKEIG